MSNHTGNRYNRPGIMNKPRFKNTTGKGRFFYSPFPYYNYNSKYGFQPQWNYFQYRRPTFRVKPRKETEPPRPPSPFTGTEEYNLKKIQEASDMIKKQLLMAPEDNYSNSERNTPPIETNKSSEASEKKSEKSDGEKITKPAKKPAEQYNVKEIHNKIINHITNLNHGKKMNLICATSSGYDVAIQQIQRQKRLELSKALRDMCLNQTAENSEMINSIIPDIGIKIEDLPLEVIRQLSTTLDLNFEESVLQNNDSQTVQVQTEVGEDEFLEHSSIKLEHVEMNGLDFEQPVQNSDSQKVQVKVEVCEEKFLAHSPTVNVKVEHIDIKGENECPMDTTDNADFFCDFPKKSETVEYKSTQTDFLIRSSNGTQTDLNVFYQLQVKNDAETLEEAISSMLDIDKEITRLTQLRQSIFLKLQAKNLVNSVKDNKRKTKNNAKIDKTIQESQHRSEVAKDKSEDVFKKELEFKIKSEKILVLQVFEETLFAGSESGKLFYVDLITGNTLATIQVGEMPVTALCFWNKNKPSLYVSSLDPRLREYNRISRKLLRQTRTKAGVQCMEQAWGFIFLGSVTGALMRYSLSKMRIEFEERISCDRILVLKATQEGARRVLLVGTKNYPVCVRDAMSGLHMRTMNDIITPTVYSLLLENSLVYCGTTFHDILVYSFNEGTLVRKYQATNSKGVGCMKMVDNLLFASCYNGNIYVYNTKTRQYVGVMDGPGGVILSMEIVKNLVIVGTMSLNFKSILIPEYILESNRSTIEL